MNQKSKKKKENPKFRNKVASKKILTIWFIPQYRQLKRKDENQISTDIIILLIGINI